VIYLPLTIAMAGQDAIVSTQTQENEMNLTKESKELFTELAEDADNWSGTPLYERTDAASKGNLTDLKKKGLITTHSDDGCNDGDPCTWVSFTEAGTAYANDELGIDVS
jgi:hypothetical protein